jgi:hypothetical protein
MFMMTPSLDQILRNLPRGGGRRALHFTNEVGLALPISRVSRVQVGRQVQQLIVWRTAQPRSQLIKVLAAGDADEQPARPLAQETI